MALGMEVGLSPGNFVSDGDPAPPQKGGGFPNFLPISTISYLYCGQTAARIKMPIGTEVGLGPDDIVLDGDPAPLRRKGAEAPLLFSVHVYCGQTAGCIKMPLGMKVGLSPGDFVLDEDPAIPEKGWSPEFFGPRLLWPNGCMDQDVTWYGGRPRPR